MEMIVNQGIESEYGFTLASIEYVDLAYSKYELFSKTQKIPPNNHIRIKLYLNQYTGQTAPRHTYSKTPIWFFTNEPYQYLHIDLETNQEHGNQPRFYLDHLEIKEGHSKNHLKAIENRVHGSTVVVTDLPENKFRKHTNSITLKLEFPTLNEPNSFYFSLYAIDIESPNRKIICDPLVGNDPPDKEPKS